MSNLSENAKSFISGWVTGCSQVLVMQPFEIIKVRQINEIGDSLKYKGFIKSFKTILLEEGALTFYKGKQEITKELFPPFSGMVCRTLFNLASIDSFEESKQPQMTESKQQTHFLWQEYQQAFQVQQQLYTFYKQTPADHMRILMQKQYHGKSQKYSGQFSAAKDILFRHGPKGLYLGFSTTLLRQFFAMAIYFTTFQEMKKLMRHDPKGGISEKIKIMFAGALAGLASWVFPYPIDFVKTKMQSQNLDQRKYKNSWHCFTQNYKQYGWRGFTRGLWTVCLRSIPVNSIAFLIEDETAKFLGRKQVSEW